MSEKQIEHTGIVQAVGNGKLTVNLMRVSACSSCSAKSVCSVPDSEKKVIEVSCSGGEMFTVGEKVMVALSEELGLRALAIGYLIPFVLLVTTLFIASQFTTEAIAGILSIAILAPYYLILLLLRNKLTKTFTFKVMKI